MFCLCLPLLSLGRLQKSHGWIRDPRRGRMRQRFSIKWSRGWSFDISQSPAFLVNTTKPAKPKSIKMKVIFALAVLIAVAAARPGAEEDKKAEVLEYNNDNIGVGPWNWK